MLTGFALYLILFLPFLYAKPSAMIADLSWQAKRPIEAWKLGLNQEMRLFIILTGIFWIIFFKTLNHKSHNLLLPIINYNLYIYFIEPSLSLKLLTLVIAINFLTPKFFAN